MISGFLFVMMRCIQFFFLIPPLGMLSAVVHIYLINNEVTPPFALVLFIVVVLASIWVLATLLFYRAARHNGYFLAFIDMCFFGALIAGVVVANVMATQSCSNFSITSSAYKQSGIWVYNFTELCNLVKASYAFAIMEIIFFFTTMLLALWVHHHHAKEDRDNGDSYSRRTEKRSSRRSQPRSRSAGDNGSRDNYNSRYDDRSRRGGSVPRRSDSRSYV